MNRKIKIAVTGVGGGVGQSIVKCLYNKNYEIIGLEPDPLAAGVYAVSMSYKIPLVSDKNYINYLLKLCKKEKIKLLFPGLDTELSILSKNREKFAAIRTTVVVGSPDVIETADNKLKTYQVLSAGNIPVAYTILLEDFLIKKTKIKFPVILKPLVGGSRSIDVYKLNNKKELDWLVSKPGFQKDKFILQEYLEGEEYTCGTVNWNNKCHGVIVMKRVLRAGDTYKCFVVEDKKMEEVVLKVMDLLKPFGACNVQLRIKDGIPTVFEINSRCSGTTGPRALAGFNEPKMIADYLCFKRKPKFKSKKISILRYWKELIVDNSRIETFKKSGKVVNKKFQAL